MSCSLFKPTTPLRTKIGVVVTAVYLLLLGLLLYTKWADLIALDLNELGDFAAGAFGPLAFLWLILGYMQQGDELKQNTEALKLQADELAKTVEQQKELVALGHQQLEREKELAIQEQQRQALASQPTFDSSVLVITPRPSVWQHLEISISNVGPACSHLTVTTSRNDLRIGVKKKSTDSQSWLITFTTPRLVPFENFKFNISYLDCSGKPDIQTLSVEYYEGQILVIDEAVEKLSEFHQSLPKRTGTTN